MQDPIILELRGNGALVRTFLISDAELRHLTELAEKYGEPLETAWFDPAFRWRKEVKTILDQIIEVSTYRGLLIDGRSFLEIRQPYKRRRKFTMTELLRTDQLFPLVRSRIFCHPEIKAGQNLLIEITHGIGCLGRFETDVFDLGELELAVFKLPAQNQEVALCTAYLDKEMMCSEDDFLVRGNELLTCMGK